VRGKAGFSCDHEHRSGHADRLQAGQVAVGTVVVDALRLVAALLLLRGTHVRVVTRCFFGTLRVLMLMMPHVPCDLRRFFVLAIACSHSPGELERQDQQKEYRQGAAHGRKVYVG